MNCPHKHAQNIERWLEDNRYALPNDTNDYPNEAVVPFYHGRTWMNANYVAVGPVIVYPHPDFGVFWQKLVLSKKEKVDAQKLKHHFPNDKQQAEALINALSENLYRADSYLKICIHVLDGEEGKSADDLKTVLQDTQLLLENFLNLFYHVSDLIKNRFQ